MQFSGSFWALHTPKCKRDKLVFQGDPNNRARGDSDNHILLTEGGRTRMSSWQIPLAYDNDW